MLQSFHHVVICLPPSTTPMSCTGKPKSGQGPPGSTRIEQSREVPSLNPLAKFCRCKSRDCWAPVPKDTLLAHINFVSTRSPSFFPASHLIRLQNILVLGFTSSQVEDFILTSLGECHVAPGHRSSSLSRLSEWQHNTPEYQPLHPALYHLQSKFQTQINMKWIEPEEVRIEKLLHKNICQALEQAAQGSSHHSWR